MNNKERASRLQSLKPGDEVIVFRWDVPLWLRKVSSVTKSGRVRIWRYEHTEGQYVEYGSNGNVRGERSASRWYGGEFERTKIEPVTDEVRAKIAEAQAEADAMKWRSDSRHRIYRMDWHFVISLTDDQLRAIEAILWPPKPAEVPPALVVEDPAPLAAGAARGGEA